MTIDHSACVGFPAEPTRVHREQPTYRAHPAGRSHNAKPAAEEYGWLTPLRQTTGDTRLWVFRCRCGEQLFREMGSVRRAQKKGRISKCNPKCAGRTTSAGAMGASTSTTPGGAP